MQPVDINTIARDKEEIKGKGRFHMRMMARQLGIAADPTSDSAFMSLDNDKMAEKVLEVLLLKDKETKSAAPAAPKANGKSPVTKSTTKAVSTEEASAPNGAVSGDFSSVLKALGDIEGKTVASKELATINHNLLLKEVAGIKTVVYKMFTLNLMLAEQQLQASRADILTMVEEDAAALQAADEA